MPKLPQSLSLWKRHQSKWRNCNVCQLCEGRTNVVLAKGPLPCDVLFIGEAPGVSEDFLGQPFIGPAGQLLDQQIAEATENLGIQPRMAFTNLVCCIPLDGDTGRKVKEPHKDHIAACKPRLDEFIELAQPARIVAVGDLADKHLNADYKVTHPAAVLRADVVRQSLMYNKAVVMLENALEGL